MNPIDPFFKECIHSHFPTNDLYLSILHKKRSFIYQIGKSFPLFDESFSNDNMLE